MRITNSTRNTELCRNAVVARTFWTRLVGLIGRRSLPKGHGLVITPCRSVHTMFMRFPIDVIYVDRSRRVVKTVSALKPYRASLGGASAESAIELPAGTVGATTTAVGDALTVDENGEDAEPGVRITRA